MREYEEKILTLLEKRGADKSICPSEILEPAEKKDKVKMELVRAAAKKLASQNKIILTQKGKKIDPQNFKGPIRLKLTEKNSKQKINIVWLKKDLRLFDHEALYRAMQDCHQNQSKLMIVYLFEPSIMSYPDFSEMHLQFIIDSIQNLNSRLLKFNYQICTFHKDALEFFKFAKETFKSYELEFFAHEEIGNQITFKRDIEVRNFLKQLQINFNEYQTNGIIRGKRDKKWHKKWFEKMSSEVYNPNYQTDVFFPFKANYLPSIKANHQLQKGGETSAHYRLKKFFHAHIMNYRYSLSRPIKAIDHCSRLSPYLAFGNISIRQIYRSALGQANYLVFKKDYDAFIDRLLWHCHFIQRFEYFPEIEFKNLNKSFDQIRNKSNPDLHRAFIDGQTGFPLIDASIRALKQTGYINFRMRSMLVSFYTHHLFLPWQDIAHFLAKNFLDYEPGIHYSQIQMQAGTIGIHTIRIYNPILQSLEKDPKGEFILKWIPELRNIPKEFIHQPEEIPSLIALSCNFQIGRDYPFPIIDLKKSAKEAREKLWAIKKLETTQIESKKILKKR